MLQQLNIVGDSCESTLVLTRKLDILSISYATEYDVIIMSSATMNI